MVPRLPVHRWAATYLAARLGLIAAILCGVAFAFQLGGKDGAALPISALLGAPTDMVLMRLGAFPPRVLDSAGYGNLWDLFHLMLCGSIALNWTLVGLGIDLVRRLRRPSPVMVALAPDDPEDALLAAGRDALLDEFAALERTVRARTTADPGAVASRNTQRTE